MTLSHRLPDPSLPVMMCRQDPSVVIDSCFGIIYMFQFDRAKWSGRWVLKQHKSLGRHRVSEGLIMQHLSWHFTVAAVDSLIYHRGRHYLLMPHYPHSCLDLPSGFRSLT